MSNGVYYIVKVDIGSKQKYIFSSNRLKEIIGASEIIKFVTEELGKQILKSMGESTENFVVDINSSENYKGNILFEAGGNAMYIFDTREKAERFNQEFSRFVIKHFDGLELLMVIEKFDLNNRDIRNLYDEIENKLTIKKGKRKSDFKRIGYGLTKLCTSTRKPAIYVIDEKEIDDETGKSKDEPRLVSKEAKDKYDFYCIKYGKERLKDNELNIQIEKSNLGALNINKCGISKALEDKLSQLNEKIKNDKFKFTTELDIIAGDINEGSYIGITCIDGNGMGKKIDTFKKNSDFNGNTLENNTKYILEFNKLTNNIRNKYLEAFLDTVNILIDNYESYREEIKYSNKEYKIIPLRPVILAGDDINFISNGKIAIEATKIFTQKITEAQVDFGGKVYNLTTSAGIAIVKRNHPFSRAVKLAEQLEKNSKKRLKKIKKAFANVNTKIPKQDDDEYEVSLMDWHIDRGNSLEEIISLRKKNGYDNSDNEEKDINELVARPYTIVPSNAVSKLEGLKTPVTIENSKDIGRLLSCKMENFNLILNTIINDSEGRSNIKGLFRTMNEGDTEAKLFSLKYNLQDRFKGNINLEVLNQIVYDVIEVLDLYTYVEKGEKTND